MRTMKRLPWKLIIVLALVQLIRPILSTLGVFDNVRPQGPIIATIVIALIWIGVMVVRKVKRPTIVLAMAGVVYAVLSIILAVLLQTVFTWSAEETIPVAVLLTGGLIGAIGANIIWGGFLGLIASLVMKVRKT